MNRTRAKENLEKMRDMSIERLNQKLDEWEKTMGKTFFKKFL